MVQSSLTRRDEKPRRHRALKRTAKIKPSLRDEEDAHFVRKLRCEKTAVGSLLKAGSAS